MGHLQFTFLIFLSNNCDLGWDAENVKDARMVHKVRLSSPKRKMKYSCILFKTQWCNLLPYLCQLIVWQCWGLSCQIKMFPHRVCATSPSPSSSSSFLLTGSSFFTEVLISTSHPSRWALKTRHVPHALLAAPVCLSLFPRISPETVAHARRWLESLPLISRCSREI